VANCIFSSQDYWKKCRAIENEFFVAQFDPNPVAKGHMTIVSKRHVESFFDLTEKEVLAGFSLIEKAKTLVDKKFSPDAYTIGLNNGKAAGQTIFHLHIHLIPRYTSDVKDPIGGVRNVIPEKGNYLKKKGGCFNA